MTKVAINTCFGGFGLSDEAFEMLLDRKGIEWEKIEGKRILGGYHYYKKGGDPDRDDDGFYDFMFYNDRTDPDLIAVIEELGELSYGDFAELEIVEVPDDIIWGIHEYDGNESVKESS